MTLNRKQKTIIIKQFQSDYSRTKVTTGTGNEESIESIKDLPFAYKLEGFEKAPPIVYLDVENKGTHILLKSALTDVNDSGRYVYNLSNRCNYLGVTENTPNYIDIPKRVGSTYYPPLLITPALKGESIIITNHSPQNYRVYYDRRENSSILYNDVVYSFDSIDYRYNYDKDTKTFSRKKNQTIFLCGSFNQGTKSWDLFTYHDVDSITKPYHAQYERKNAQLFSQFATTQEETIDLVKQFKEQKSKELKKKVAEKRLPTLTGAELERRINLGVTDVAVLYHQIEEDIINNSSNSNSQKELRHNQNITLLAEILSSNGILDTLEIKLASPNGFEEVVKVIDNLEAIPLRDDYENQDLYYKNLALYYFNIGDDNFRMGYILPEEYLGETYTSTSLQNLYEDLSNRSNESTKRGALIRAIHLKNLEIHANSIATKLTNLVGKYIDAFFFFDNQTYDANFAQRDLLVQFQLNQGDTDKGVCYALSLLHNISNEMGIEDTFKNFLKNFSTISTEDVFFLRKFIEKIQVSQNRSGTKVGNRDLSLKEIKQGFENNTLKHVLVSSKKHATSLIKVDDSNYSFFNPNYGVLYFNSIDKALVVIKDTLTPIEKDKYNIAETSILNKGSHNNIAKISLDGVSIRSLLNNMHNGAPLTPSNLTMSAVRVLNNPFANDRIRVSAENINLANDFVDVLNHEQFFEKVPLIRTAQKDSDSSYSIDTIDKTTNEIQKHTLTKEDYKVIKKVYAKIKELKDDGVSWDNKTNKWKFIESLDSVNNKYAKIFAFRSLIQIINNQLSVTPVANTKNIELRNYIIAQMYIDLSEASLDVGTELVVPSVNYLKKVLTQTGFKTFLGTRYAFLGVSILGIALSAASLGLSIKILTETDIKVDPLSFEIAVINIVSATSNLILSVASLILIFAGFAAFATVLGAIGIIISLLTLFIVGAKILNQARTNSVKGVITFFKSLYDMATKDIFSEKDGLLIPENLPITSINCITGVVTLGSYLTYKSELVRRELKHPGLGKIIVANEIRKNKSTPPTVDILSRFDIVKSKTFKNLAEQSSIVLPATPNLILDYNYLVNPDFSKIPNQELIYGKKLEEKGNFVYSNRDPSKKEHIIKELIPSVQNTKISIILAPKNIIIIVPPLNNDNTNLVTYNKIKTEVTPSSEHKELHCFVGLGSHLTMLPSTQKIKYTFDFSCKKTSPSDPSHELSEKDGIYTINKYNTLKLTPSSLVDDSFSVKDNYEEYTFNTRTKKKTYHVVDAMSLSDVRYKTPSAVYPVVSNSLTKSQVLVKRMVRVSTTDPASHTLHGMYAEEFGKIIIDKNPSYLTHLNLKENISGGYYSEEAKLIYFYSYSESIVWAINLSGVLKHVFSLCSLSQNNNNKSELCFYSPSDKDYKLTSFTPFKDGVIVTYTKISPLNHRELKVFCNKNGMTLMQHRVIKRENPKKVDDDDISNLFSLLSERAVPLASDTPQDKKQALITKLINSYSKDVKEHLKYNLEGEPSRIRLLKFDNVVLEKIKFSNLSANYNVSINHTGASFKEETKPLGNYNVLESIPNNYHQNINTYPSSQMNKDVFFSITDLENKKDIMKPLCMETSEITVLGQSKGLYYFYTKKDAGKIYIQKESGSGLHNDELLITIKANDYNDIRLDGDNLILKRSDGALFSYNYEKKIYTVLVAGSKGLERGGVPNRVNLKTIYSLTPTRDDVRTYKLADLVLLNSLNLSNPEEKIYSYLDTYLILHKNNEILNIVTDITNSNLRYIWYVSKSNDGTNRLYRVIVDLTNTVFNEQIIRATSDLMYSGIKDGYNEIGFRIESNIYKFTHNKQGVELINSSEDFSPIDGYVSEKDLVSGYILKSNGSYGALNSFIVSGTRMPVKLSDELRNSIKLIGKVDKNIFFLNKTDNRLMVAHSKDDYQVIKYKYHKEEINPFEDVYNQNNVEVYSIKKGLNSYKIKLDTSYIDDCNTSYLLNGYQTLNIKFEQSYMNKINTTSIDGREVKKLILQFPNLLKMSLSVNLSSITFYDSLSDFKLVLPDILAVKVGVKLKIKNIVLRLPPPTSSGSNNSGNTDNIDYKLDSLLNNLLSECENNRASVMTKNICDLITTTVDL